MDRAVSSNKTILYVIFLITFAIGCVLRLMNFGWLMFFLLIPEVIFRLIYLALGIYIISRDGNKALICGMQASYLLASFCNYDGGDTSAYAFSGLWINPPGYIADTANILYVSFVALTLILLVVGIVKSRRK